MLDTSAPDRCHCPSSHDQERPSLGWEWLQLHLLHQLPHCVECHLLWTVAGLVVLAETGGAAKRW